MKKLFTLILFLAAVYTAQAQIDTTLLRRIPKDTSKRKLNMDAIYNRPFLGIGKVPVSLGGYVEANYQHLGTDGVSAGDQFQFRRLSLFIASSISKRIKFITEIEFGNNPAGDDEGGTGPETEIEIEYAALDVEFNPLFNFRGGLVINPIGAFNQNHDGPKWEFTDRPIPMEQMLPDTWSNPGFGFYGKQYSNNWMFGYEVYLTGGFDNSIIDNTQSRTSLPAAKENRTRMVSSASGRALITGKLALRNTKIGELGISYMGGTYNKFIVDGFRVDDPRRVNVFDIDFNTVLPKLNTAITAEWAWINVQLPPNYIQQYGSKQQGGYVDIVQPVLKGNLLGWNRATLNLACRVEYVDWNVGKFRETNGNIGDSLWSVMPAVSFRPTPQTVFRLNYRIQKQYDILSNPPANTRGLIFGVSTYF